MGPKANDKCPHKTKRRKLKEDGSGDWRHQRPEEARRDAPLVP